MKYFKRIVTVLAIVALIAGLAGCKEGPLERKKKKIDKAVEDFKQ